MRTDIRPILAFFVYQLLFASGALAVELSHWVDRATEGLQWQLSVVRGSSTTGLLRDVSNDRVFWLCFDCVADGRVLVQEVNVTDYSAWRFDGNAVQSDYLSGIQAEEGFVQTEGDDHMMLDNAMFGGEALQLVRVAGQPMRSYKHTIPCIPGPTDWIRRNAVPVEYTLYEVQFADRKFAELEHILLHEATMRWRSFLVQVKEDVVQKGCDVASYFHYSSRIQLYQVERNSVTVLLHEVLGRVPGRSNVRTTVLAFQLRDGVWQPHSHKPELGKQGRFVRILPLELQEESTLLESPELPPSGWLPGGIAYWGEGTQASFAEGPVFAKWLQELP
jgi:hypothetical protein